jgi:hypothetical protein
MLESVTMSTDEEAAIIGRMVVERSDLNRKNSALCDEIKRIGEALQTLGRSLVGEGYTLSPSKLELTAEHRAILDSEKIAELLAERKVTDRRLSELTDSLKNAGV